MLYILKLKFMYAAVLKIWECLYFKAWPYVLIGLAEGVATNVFLQMKAILLAFPVALIACSWFGITESRFVCFANCGKPPKGDGAYPVRANKRFCVSLTDYYLFFIELFQLLAKNNVSFGFIFWYLPQDVFNCFQIITKSLIL